MELEEEDLNELKRGYCVEKWPYGCNAIRRLYGAGDDRISWLFETVWEEELEKLNTLRIELEKGVEKLDEIIETTTFEINESTGNSAEGGADDTDQSEKEKKLELVDQCENAKMAALKKLEDVNGQIDKINESKNKNSFSFYRPELIDRFDKCLNIEEPEYMFASEDPEQDNDSKKCTLFVAKMILSRFPVNYQAMAFKDTFYIDNAQALILQGNEIISNQWDYIQTKFPNAIDYSGILPYVQVTSIKQYRKKCDPLIYIAFITQFMGNLCFKNQFKYVKNIISQRKYALQHLFPSFRAMVSALEFLATRKCYHGRIGIQNIFITPNGKSALLAEFLPFDEIVRFCLDVSNSVVPILSYTAPEIIKLRGLNISSKDEILKIIDFEKVDVFAFGIVVLELISYENMAGLNMNQSAIASITSKLTKKVGSPITDMVKQVVEFDPNVRPTWTGVQRLLQNITV